MPGHDITPKRSSRLASRGLTPKHCGRLQYNPQTPRQTLAICGITVKCSGRLEHSSQMQWRIPVSPLIATSLPNAAAGRSKSRHRTQTFWQTVASRGIVPKRHGWPWQVVGSPPPLFAVPSWHAVESWSNKHLLGRKKTVEDGR